MGSTNSTPKNSAYTKYELGNITGIVIDFLEGKTSTDDVRKIMRDLSMSSSAKSSCQILTQILTQLLLADGNYFDNYTGIPCHEATYHAMILLVNQLREFIKNIDPDDKDFWKLDLDPEKSEMLLQKLSIFTTRLTYEWTPA